MLTIRHDSRQIPIASDARPFHTSRGFLHWRFAYAGPTVRAAPPSWGRHPQTFTDAEVCIGPIIQPLISGPVFRTFARVWKSVISSEMLPKTCWNPHYSGRGHIGVPVGFEVPPLRTGGTNAATSHFSCLHADVYSWRCAIAVSADTIVKIEQVVDSRFLPPT